MLIVSWDPFLMKKLLKNDVYGSVNSAQIHCSHRKSTFKTSKNKKSKKRKCSFNPIQTTP